CLALLGGWPRGIRAVAAVSLVVAATLASTTVRDRERAREAATVERATHLPRAVADGGYVSSDACRSCHPEQYATWHATYHRTMTQPASPETIVAPFDDVRLSAAGQVYTLRRDGDDFWVETSGSPGVRRQVVMVTGSHHQQRYWLRGQGGNALDLL